MRDTVDHPPACVSDPGSRRLGRLRRPSLPASRCGRGPAPPAPVDDLAVLTAGLAHDLNNLLAVVVVNVECLADPRLDPAEREAIHRETRDACDRARGIARQMVDVGRRRSRREVVRLADELDRIRDLLARTAGPAVDVSVDVATAGWVALDAGQLGQVLVNLVANARDAMPGGGRVTVGVRAADPDEVARRRPAAAGVPHVALTVADRGTGMTPATLARVFEPFFTTKPRDRGTGLGLPMVCTIVEDHGGFVDVASRPGSGTRVTLYLPLATRPAS